MADGIRASIAKGVFTEELLIHMRGVSRSVCATRPSPSGGRWSDGDIDDLIFDAIARVSVTKVVLAGNEASTDAEFTKWIRKLLVTQLNLRARGTPQGIILRDVEAAISEDTDFEAVGPHWRLRAQPQATPWTGQRGPLVAAAFAVDTKVIRRDPMAERTQTAWRSDTRAVCRAVLQVAGLLDRVELAKVVAERFNMHHVPAAEYLDDVLPESVTQRVLDEASEHETMEAAESVLAQLTSEELVIASHICEGTTLRELGGVLGCGKSKADILEKRVRAKLRKLADEYGPEADRVILSLAKKIGRLEQTRHSDDRGSDTHD